MTTLHDQISARVAAAFSDAGYDPAFAKVTLSNRPDLSDFQCNGAMQARGATGKNPKDIANDIRDRLIADTEAFAGITVDGPGFLNLRLTETFLQTTLAAQCAGGSVIAPSEKIEKIIIDYGGPNVAKPLHVGHLRSAIIGEAVKRIARALGHTVLGDIHLGDWGAPMGMLIAQLEEAHPDWPYFQEGFVPSAATDTAPFTVDAMNTMYPEASARTKEDPAFAEAARVATAKLQDGHAGYRALWRHFVSLSVASIKGDYKHLDVDFDLWLGESDADPVIEPMIAEIVAKGLARESDGAIVVDIARDTDKSPKPPLMLRKSSGAVSYATTDLATIKQRVDDHKVDRVLYVVDKRQDQHFDQVFRAAAALGLISEDRLEHTAFGTMNGRDGKPFKTRDGGVMRLNDLILMAQDLALTASGFTRDEARAEGIEDMIDAIAIGAIKFGDLSNPRVSDYVFDPAEFVRFEGKTGPYIQYTAVRARAILSRMDAPKGNAIENGTLGHKTERDLALLLLGFAEAVKDSYAKRMPSELCDYIYRLAKAFNAFYSECNVANEPDAAQRALRYGLTAMTADVIAKSFDMLAMPMPERMVRKDSSEASAA